MRCEGSSKAQLMANGTLLWLRLGHFAHFAFLFSIVPTPSRGHLCAHHCCAREWNNMYRTRPTQSVQRSSRAVRCHQIRHSTKHFLPSARSEPGHHVRLADPAPYPCSRPRTFFFFFSIKPDFFFWLGLATFPLPPCC